MFLDFFVEVSIGALKKLPYQDHDELHLPQVQSWPHRAAPKLTSQSHKSITMSLCGRRMFEGPSRISRTKRATMVELSLQS